MNLWCTVHDVLHTTAIQGYYCQAILPIAMCFAFSLVLSNLAYRYCTVAFLQMIKEGLSAQQMATWPAVGFLCQGNIMVIYAMAYLFGIETHATTKVGPFFHYIQEKSWFFITFCHNNCMVSTGVVYLWCAALKYDGLSWPSSSWCFWPPGVVWMVKCHLGPKGRS